MLSPEADFIRMISSYYYNWSIKFKCQ